MDIKKYKNIWNLQNYSLPLQRFFLIPFSDVGKIACEDMAKIAGISGTLAGKVGNIVYSVLKGVNIARQYNPAPFNPSSPAQVEARAKLKLISQLSAVTANQLAIVRKATETARNAFVKINYAFMTYSEGAASMPVANMQLTSGFAGFPGFTVVRVPNYGMSVELAEKAFPAFDKVVWVVYKVLSDGKLMFNESKVLDLTEQHPTGATIMQSVVGDCSIHCYGISTKTAKAAAAFEDMVVVTAEEVARIISTRVISDSDVTLSETRGLYLKESESEGATTGAGASVTLGFDPASSVQQGELTGGGFHPFGSQVTVTAPEVAGHTFAGWYSSLAQQTVSSNREYTFTMGTKSFSLFANYRTT